MARNGTGTFNLLNNTWNPASNGNAATANDWQALANDIASGLTQSVSADGQTPITGDLLLSTNKIRGVAAGTVASDAVILDQIGGFTGYIAATGNILLTASQGGNYIAIGAANLTISLPSTSGLRIGKTYTFGAARKFTIISTSGENIAGPYPSPFSTSIDMFGYCSIVWRGDVWQIVLGNEAILKTGNGYLMHANGLIIQWGSLAVIGTATVTLPIAFPTAYISAYGNGQTGIDANVAASSWVEVTTAGLTQIFVKVIASSPSGNVLGARGINWLAFGY